MTTVAITCSRSLHDHDELLYTFGEAVKRVDRDHVITRWLHGDAPRGDRQLAAWLQKRARLWGWEVEAVPADYDRYPPHVAPLERNSALVERAEFLIAIWQPPAPGARKKGGTFDTICKAAAKGIPVVVEVLS